MGENWAKTPHFTRKGQAVVVEALKPERTPIHYELKLMWSRMPERTPIHYGLKPMWTRMRQQPRTTRAGEGLSPAQAYPVR